MLFDRYRVFMAIDTVMTQEVRHTFMTALGLQDCTPNEIHYATLQRHELSSGHDGS
jgi:hypothetical protein